MGVKKVCKCGSTEFSAHQICRVDVVVDSNNYFLDNLGGSMESACYDAETPYGPYSCMKCGTEFGELDELEYSWYSEELTIEPSRLEELNRICSMDETEFNKAVEDGLLEKDSLFFSKVVKFDDNSTIEIRLLTGQSNPWGEYVFFNKDGLEMDCGIIDFDISGEYQTKKGKCIYSLLVG